MWGSEAFLPTPPYWPGSPSGQNSMHSHGLLNVLGLLCRMLYHLQTVSLLSSFCFILLSSWISQNYEHYKSITESKCSFSFLFFRRHLKSFVSVISEICFWYMIKFLLCSVFSDFFFMYSWAWISQVYLMVNHPCFSRRNLVWTWCIWFYFILLKYNTLYFRVFTYVFICKFDIIFSLIQLQNQVYSLCKICSIVSCPSSVLKQFFSEWD